MKILRILFMPIGIILLFLLTICKKILEIIATLATMISSLYIFVAAILFIYMIFKGGATWYEILSIFVVAGIGVITPIFAGGVLFLFDILISKIKSITFSTNNNANYNKVQSISSNVERREYVSSKINNIDTNAMTDDQIQFLYTQVLNKN